MRRPGHARIPRVRPSRNRRRNHDFGQYYVGPCGTRSSHCDGRFCDDVSDVSPDVRQAIETRISSLLGTGCMESDVEASGPASEGCDAGVLDRIARLSEVAVPGAGHARVRRQALVGAGGGFLLSAPLRRTAEMPVDASISCAGDRLSGLKENVIVGQLIPTATLRITR